MHACFVVLDKRFTDYIPLWGVASITSLLQKLPASVVCILFSRVRIASCCGNLEVTRLSFSRWEQSLRQLTERPSLTFISLTLPTVISGSCASPWITGRRCVYVCVFAGVNVYYTAKDVRVPCSLDGWLSIKIGYIWDKVLGGDIALLG